MKYRSRSLQIRQVRFEALRDIYRTMTPEDAAKVKEIEKVTNHDVKAVEYYIKDRFKEWTS